MWFSPPATVSYDVSARRDAHTNEGARTKAHEA